MAKRDELGNAIAFGAVAAGLFGVFAAIASSTGQAATPAPQRLIIGGVDITDVDFSKPFFVDFSTPANAPAAARLDANKRLATAYQAFIQTFPGYLIRPDVSPQGRAILWVDPPPQRAFR